MGLVQVGISIWVHQFDQNWSRGGGIKSWEEFPSANWGDFNLHLEASNGIQALLFLFDDQDYLSWGWMRVWTICFVLQHLLIKKLSNLLTKLVYWPTSNAVDEFHLWVGLFEVVELKGGGKLIVQKWEWAVLGALEQKTVKILELFCHCQIWLPSTKSYFMQTDARQP